MLTALWRSAALRGSSLAPRAFGDNVPDVVQMLIYGAGIVAASFVLAWAAEAARQTSRPIGHRTALALVAVLPEYAVDLYYAFQSGSDHTTSPMLGEHERFQPSVARPAGRWWCDRILGGEAALPFPRMPTQDTLLLPHDSRRTAGSRRLALAGFFIPLTGSIPVWFGVALILVFIAYLAVACCRGSENPRSSRCPR